ncbi:unnamed protein product (macronuclear) [Paramecium tetraurelia]|uniref:Peptidase M14 domain-containing protein n=1 Tax=Paramecium tetraurelia TaxID=5888 RepID=A0BLY9_PARTE|nr:uncharacterized protein GSPATT00030190001 [Paramecium tetraurelia]CAK59556.1 unnamed protein product [Paramecium tetraurelia]|eukprot:XP_001426954.1 hypothetical protein (macronuclear) [Paramecium tetraurelia strain d4-2]
MNSLFLTLFSLIQAYQYYSYQEIVDTFKKLEIDHTDVFRLYYPTKDLDNLRYLDCGDEECQFFYAEFAQNPNAADLPTVLIAAGFHGDEVIGQNVVTELAKYLTSESKLEFLNNRRILLYPMVNPYGYYHKVREEMGKDANRDFNVDNPSSICFQTNAARGLAQVYNKYIIQLGITFHGGDNSISYSWGTCNHKQNGMATESPDDSAMEMIARIMKDIAAENNNLQIQQYSIGRMTDLVYEVNGGYEDWAYAAGWDRTNTCGNRNSEEYLKPSSNARALTYLIEAGFLKQPKSNTLGTIETTNQMLQNWPPLHFYDQKLLTKYQQGYGNINRNLMASLSLIDLAKPYLIAKWDGEKEMILNFGGCYSVTKLTIIRSDKKSIIQDQNTTGIWDQFNKGYVLPNITKNDLFEISYQCDVKQFKTQRNPDPKLQPQSYFVQSRINDTYEYRFDQYLVQNTNKILYRINVSELNHTKINSLFETQQVSIYVTTQSEDHQDQQISPNQNNNKKEHIWWLLAIFIVLSFVLTILLYKYCSKKQEEEVMEMYTIQNEAKL